MNGVSGVSGVDGVVLGTGARVLLLVAGIFGLVAACGPAGAGGDDDAPGAVSGDDDAPGAVSGELTVFAAASLTDAFDALSAAFVDTNPDVEVVRNHAGSQILAHQINEGAPADVFVSADREQMDAVEAAGNLAGEVQVLTSNVLAIAVEPGNPLGVGGLEDLADPKLVLVLPAAEVPAGRYARQALVAAGVEVSPASLEQGVRAALSKVELGEADAAIVFASDVIASDTAEGVEIPAAHNVVATYPVAVLRDAPNAAAAQALVAFALAEDGQEILADHGFTSP